MRTASSLVALLLAAGCASLDKDECISADWYAIGLEDGARGRAVERLGVGGRAGHAYAAGCPAPLAGNFLAAYQRGRELHELNRQLDALEAEIGRSKKALTDGIPNPRSRAAEVERLEALTREAQQLELRIQDTERR